MILHPRLKALFSGFNQAGIRWCLLRLPENFNGKGGDIDLLLESEDFQTARKILATQQFAWLPEWKPALHYLSFDRPTNQWLWLHICTELSFGPYELLTTGCERDCMERRQIDHQGADIFTLAENDAFWELLLHCLINKGKITERHRICLQQLAQVDVLSSPLVASIETACPDGWNAERIVISVIESQWDLLEGISPTLTATWMHRSRVGIWELLLAKVAWKYTRFFNGLQSCGVTVALLGPDGAGKSTAISGLRDTFLLPMVTIYMGLTGGLLPYVNRLWLPFLVIPGRLLVFWARYMRGKFYQSLGRLVVFERYIFDWAVPTPFPLNRLQRAIRWIDGHCLPGPDLVFILDAPGEVMFKRKGEYNPQMLEDWRQRFKALRDRIPHCEVIDTTLPAKEVLAEVTDHIWQIYASRWIERKSSEVAARM